MVIFTASKKQFMKKIFFAIATSFTCTIAFSQNVGIGTTTPVEKLDVSGNIKTTGEIKPNGVAGQSGEVLTSNGNGTMQWAQAKAVANSNGNGGWGDCSIYNIDSFQIGADPDGVFGDRMGYSVAISGNYAIAGISGDDDGGFTDCGSAMIFIFNAVTGKWEKEAKIFNPNASNGDFFGTSVAITAEGYAIVGAYADDDGAIVNSGSATIFKRNNITGAWESQGKILNPFPAAGDNFGVSVAISNDYAVIGANDDDEGYTDNGTIMILKRNTVTGVWEIQTRFAGPASENGEGFGYRVGLSGDHLIVGVPLDDVSGKTDCGSFVIYKRNATTGFWENQGKFLDATLDNGEYTGRAVSISGDYAIIGIPGDTEKGYQSGAALIYARNTVTGVWERQAKIFNTNGETGDLFGTTVSIGGEYALIGASFDDENGGLANGSSTVLKRYGTVWYQQQKFTNPGPTDDDAHFGSAAGIHANKRFVVGAPDIAFGKGLLFFGTAK